MPKPLPFSSINAIASAKNKSKREKNIFRLTPISAVFYKETISVNFQSKKQVSSREEDLENDGSKSYIESTDREKVQELSITPRFNFDSKHYTSSFIIPYEGKECDEEMQIFHINRTYQSQKQIDHSNILVPKPKSKNQYCAVCRYHYEDYLEHINDYDHKRNIRKNKFNQDIESLAKFIRDNWQPYEKEGVMTRSAKRRLETASTQHLELERKSGKKRRSQDGYSSKPIGKSLIEGEEYADGQTPFSRKWHYETTAKSIFSALD